MPNDDQRPDFSPPTIQRKEAQGRGQDSHGGDSGGSGDSSNTPALIAQPASASASKVGQAQTEGQEYDPYGARDIAAQEAMADAAIVMAVAACFTFFVTLAGTLLIWRQVKLTREAVEDTAEATDAMLAANEIARDTSERQLRAYVTVQSVSVEIKKDEEGIHFAFVAKMANSGQTPALIQARSISGEWESGNVGHQNTHPITIPPGGEFIYTCAGGDSAKATQTPISAKASISYVDYLGNKHFENSSWSGKGLLTIYEIIGTYALRCHNKVDDTLSRYIGDREPSTNG